MRNSWLSLKKGQNAEEALIFVMEDLLGKKEDSSICQDAGVQACMICLEDMGDSDRLWGANIKISPFKEFLWCLVEYEEILSFFPLWNTYVHKGKAKKLTTISDF